MNFWCCLYRWPGVRIMASVLCVLLVMCMGSVWGAQTVRLATWNVRNYNVSDRFVDGVYRTEYPKPEAEKKALRAVLCALRPDVLALQEMGGQGFLDELQRDLKADGLDYPYAVVGQGPDSARVVAVLSRLPFAHTDPHADLITAQGEGVLRGALEVAFNTEGVLWKVFVVHLKSRRTVDPADPQSALQRRDEARAIWKMISADKALRDYAVAGDFNDHARSPAMKVFTGAKKSDTRPQPLLAVDSRGERWTHFYSYEESYGRFDYLVCSPALAARVQGGARLVDSPEVLQASDHRPVWTDLVFDKGGKVVR